MEKRGVLKVVAIWALFIVYLAFIIYLSTAFLPPELPEEKEEKPPKPPPTNGTGTSPSTPGKPAEPREPFTLLKPVYYFKDNLPNFDFYVNLGLYLFFGILAFLALATLPKLDWKSVLVIAVLLGLVLSISLEIYQYFVSFRIADHMDVIYDTLGSMIGAMLMYVTFLNLDALEKEREKRIKVS
jgi:glycopeptide antibiotics resistance protein